MLLLWRLPRLGKVHLSVELESNDVFKLQAKLMIVELLLLISVGLELKWNLKLVLQTVYVMLLHNC
jgi:hypothetical protein